MAGNQTRSNPFSLAQLVLLITLTLFVVALFSFPFSSINPNWFLWLFSLTLGFGIIVLVSEIIRHRKKPKDGVAGTGYLRTIGNIWGTILWIGLGVVFLALAGQYRNVWFLAPVVLGIIWRTIIIRRRNA